MSQLKDEHLIYLSDDMYLPIHYRGIKVQPPFYSGDGVYNVSELQDLCRQFTQYVHQQQLIKQNCQKVILNLKFGILFNDLDEQG